MKVTSWYLEYRNAAQNSSKFYAINLVEDGTLTLNWGRIGTNGQRKVAKHTFSEARAIAMRQAYEKQAKGYQMIVEEVESDVAPDKVAYALKNNEPHELNQAARRSARPKAAPTPEVVAETTTRAYDSFTTVALALMERAKTEPIEYCLTEFRELREQLDDLQAQHQEAALSLDLAQQVIMASVQSSVA